MKLLVIVACLLVIASADLESADYQVFSEGSVKFGLDVYKEALKSTSGNLLACPMSADIIIALANAGAEGVTSEEIVHTLHLPAHKNKIQESMRDLLQHLKGNDDYNLTTANKIYVQEGYEIKENFQTVATNDFGSEVANIDFVDAAEAVNNINKWVEEQTHERIRNLLTPNDISKDTRLVLINALYLNANWKNEFDILQTYQLPFHLNNENQVLVETMQLTEVFKYYYCNIHNLQILEMPYVGDDLVMTIILPNETEGLTRVEAQLDEILAMPINLTDVPVEITLPKFKMESTIDFKNILSELGVIKAFDSDSAEFTGIADGPENLFINKVIQKTYISVDEQGTEAAAATAGIGLVDISLHTFYGAIPFHADHPFIFVLSHKKSGVNLFIGRVANPEL